MTDLNISLDPVGEDKFVIHIMKSGQIIKSIPSDMADALTEDDLRDPTMGLPNCGLSGIQIDRLIGLANSRRN